MIDTAARLAEIVRAAGPAGSDAISEDCTQDEAPTATPQSFDPAEVDNPGVLFGWRR